MKIRTKLSLLYLPILIACIASTGIASYLLAHSALQKKEMDILQLLASYVQQYEQINPEPSAQSEDTLYREVYSTLSEMAVRSHRDILVVDQHKETILFSTSTQLVMGTPFKDVDLAPFIFVKSSYAQWPWDMYVLQHKDVVGASLTGIAMTVVLVTLVACICAFVLLHATLRKVILSRLQLLADAAQTIEETRQPVKIDDQGNDEISELGRDLEQMSETLYHSLEEMHQASNAKSQMLAVMSHEIRTPLNGIAGLAKLLTMSGLNKTQRKYADDLLRSAHSLNNIMNDVLDFSKIEADKMELDPAPFCVNEQVNNVVDLFKVAAKEHDTLISASFGFDGNLYVIGDVVRIRQILTNFVNNAVKFTHDGMIHIYACMDDHGDLCLSVADTGIGISKAKLKDIFTTFTQSDNSISRKYGGTGLGLTICDRLVAMMNGQIGVSSNEGQGSRFLARIPVTESDEVHIEHGWDAVEEGIQLQGHVLVVEDNDINALVVTELLKCIGISTIVAENGQIALELEEKHSFDLVLMDIHMPVMDGIEATKKLRERGVTIPIIGLTAEALASRHRLFKQAGMEEVITKPVSLESLARTLGLYLPIKKED